MTIDLFRPFMSQPAVNEAVARVLSYRPDGRLYCGEGPLVKEFERRFAALVGADPATVVAVNSCSSALALALKLAGVKGGQVIATPQTCTATSGAIVNAGAKIVWADIDPLTGNIDPADVARKMTSRTRAIVAVNWGGRRCDYDRLHEINGDHWRETGVATPIIEDAAHGPFVPHGGHYTCYSFGPIKHLSCSDGGALITHLGDADRARLLRWHGLSRESKADFRCEQDITEVGAKLHMTDLNAAIGLANLPHTEWVVARHRLNAEWYHRALAGLPGITLPPFDPTGAYWLMGILVEGRDELAAYLKERGIDSSRTHRRNDEHTAFKAASSGWPLPGVDHFDAHQLNIPTGWWIGEEERQRVASAITEWAYGRKAVAA